MHIQTRMNILRARQTQTERRAAARARLLDAAITVLSTRGAAGASLQAIAEKAGLSKSAALHHFPDKASLYAAIVEENWRRNRQHLWPLVGAHPIGPDALRALLEAGWQAYRTPASMASLEVFLATRSDPTVNSQIMMMIARANEEYIGLFRSAAACASLPLPNAEAVYTLGVGVFRGLAVEQALNPRQIVEDAARSFINIICSPDLYTIAGGALPQADPENAPAPEAPEDTPLRLIHASIVSLAREGYSRTSLADVAAQAGVAKSTALHHFKDKAALMEGVVNYVWGENRNGYAHAASGASGPAALTAVMQQIWRMYKLPRSLAELEIWLASRSDEDLRIRVKSTGEAISAAAEQDFTLLCRSAGLNLANAPIAFTVGLAALRGLAIQWALCADPTVDSAAQILVSVLEKGLIQRA